jgi:hypothetical protein
MHRFRPSSATVIAFLALAVALGGTAIAAKRYLITSTSQIKPAVLRQLQAQLGRITRVQGPVVTVEPYGIANSIATCPPGYDVVSGGYYATVGAGGYVYQNESIAPHTWWAGISNQHSAEPARIQASALCAPTGQAVTVASSGRSLDRPAR